MNKISQALIDLGYAFGGIPQLVLTLLGEAIRK
jgi:hypothetical protein